jgi:phosphatidylinositol alpha-1,6-mannosyltransferase
MSRPALAAITLDPRGGGVAAVSRLIWRVFTEHWGADCALLTLSHDGTSTAGPADRLRFGADVAAVQAVGQAPWILYSHLGPARAHRYVPSPFRRPYAIFLHGIEAWRPLNRAQRETLEGASLLLANSRYTAARIAAAHPWIGPIRVCSLALDPEAPHAGSDRNGPAVGPRSVLIVARMSAAERYKGHDQLIDAWPAIASRVPDAELIVVGLGDDTARLADKARRMGLDRRVRFAGFVSDAQLAALYSQAAVFAMPSRDEGFGLVYLEAMKHKRPCIGSIHDAAGEVIDDNVTGLLVDQSDAAALTDAITSLLLNETLRTGMGALGYARWQSTFRYSSFRDRLIGLLEGAFAGGVSETRPAVPAVLSR